jgi:hypothetical protein
MSFSDDPFPSGWEIATSNYLVSNESNGEDVFESLDLDLGPGGEKVIKGGGGQWGALAPSPSKNSVCFRLF